MKILDTKPLFAELKIEKNGNLIKEQRKNIIQNIKIGTVIRVKTDVRNYVKYIYLKLKRKEGIHYIFEGESGWLQSYTLSQLMCDVSNNYIKIMGEDFKNVKK